MLRSGKAFASKRNSGVCYSSWIHGWEEKEAGGAQAEKKSAPKKASEDRICAPGEKRGGAGNEPG
jgi:hypothetical protein